MSFAVAAPLQAADLNWKGFDWAITDGGMAGVADGSAANIVVDANGYLHLHITKNGNTWTASEMFTAQNLGFGTYQWQIEGPVDVFDKQVVLGLFPYGPAAGIGGDGTNEIDIEFSRWGQANGVNADFTDYPNSGNTIGETTFKFSLDGGTSSTARMVWTHDSIESTVLKGHQPLGGEAGLIKKWKYAPTDPGTNIPQQAMPLGINLWCFDAIPTDGKNVEIVLRDFQFVKEGDPLPGTGGMGGTGSGGSANGGNASGGSTSGGSASGGKTSSGGTSNGGSGGSSNTTGGSNSAGNVGTGGTVQAGAGPVSGGSANGGASAGASSGAAPSGSGGAGSSVAGAGAGTAPSNGGRTNANPDAASDDSSGCSCHVAGGQRERAGLMALVGLTLLVGLRRSSRRA